MFTSNRLSSYYEIRLKHWYIKITDIPNGSSYESCISVSNSLDPIVPYSHSYPIEANLHSLHTQRSLVLYNSWLCKLTTYLWHIYSSHFTWMHNRKPDLKEWEVVYPSIMHVCLSPGWIDTYCEFWSGNNLACNKDEGGQKLWQAVRLTGSVFPCLHGCSMTYHTHISFMWSCLDLPNWLFMKIKESQPGM